MDPVTQNLLDGLMDGETAGAFVTWNGGNFPCCGGPELGGKLLGSGGLRLTAQVTLVVRLELFAGTPGPQEKQRLTYTSEPEGGFRALRVDTRTVFRNALLILECNDPNQAL